MSPQVFPDNIHWAVPAFGSLDGVDPEHEDYMNERAWLMPSMRCFLDNDLFNGKAAVCNRRSNIPSSCRMDAALSPRQFYLRSLGLACAAAESVVLLHESFALLTTVVKTS